MPETEPKPRLIELVGSGAGAGWKATLRDGKAVVVHEIQVPQAEAAAAVPRLQRLYEHRHPALSPVLGWGTDNNGVWIAVDANEGTPLGTILTRGPLTPPAAAALGAAVLSGIAALHEAGIAMGGFNAAAVRVTSNGDVRLAGHPAAAVRGAPSQSDLRADVRSCGMAVCAAFGVDPAGAPAPPNIPPGLVVTMRSMASGAMGPSADRAQSALREMAAALLAPDRQVAAQSELALRSGGREVPPITPFLPNPEAGAPAPAAQGAPPPIVRPQPPAPSTFTPSSRERPAARQSGIYEAPERPVQTYPSMPAYRPEPAAPIPPAIPEAPKPSPASVPTWADAPPRTTTPAEIVPATRSTNPPAPAPPVEPPAPVSPFEGATSSPPPATKLPAPVPAPEPPPAPSWIPAEPPAPTPDPPRAPSWTPAEPPVWKPGEVASPVTPAIGTPAAQTPPAASTPTAAPVVTPPVPVPPIPVPTATRPPMPARRPTVARPPRGGEPPERPSWLIPAAVAVVVILLLGIGGVVLLSSRGGPSGGPVAQHSPSPRTTSSPKASPSASPTGKSPLAVPTTFGPASAAPLTKIQFCTTATPCPIQVGTPAETATACDLNSCTIEVALYFSSGQNAPVKYDLRFFDRCSGSTIDLPGPPDYTPPGYAVVIPRDKWAVSIPNGVKSGALIAVASKPSAAASAPLLLGSATAC